MLKNNVSPLTYYKPNYFALNKNMLVFFDIFYKNNKIYLIMPIYNEPANPDHIFVTVNNKLLQLTETHIKDSNEPTLIYIYDYISPANSLIKVNIRLINKMVKSYDLRHINTRSNTNTNTITNENIKKTNDGGHFLALTTLFKNDYYLFPLFYNYYKKQGVQHFYMYYNSIITPEIKALFDKPDITLIEWGFHYWNPMGIKYSHHAQMGQMHHALYRYGKDVYDYMIFCDLDEYLHIPSKYIKNKDQSDNKDENDNKDEKHQLQQKHNITISKFIKSNPTIDIFGFCNYWSKTIDDSIPTLTTTEFPTTFLTVEKPCEYLERSKNIYKVSTINTIGIHQIGYNFYNDKTSITDLNMYHFYKWSARKREIEECIHEIEL